MAENIKLLRKNVSTKNSCQINDCETGSTYDPCSSALNFPRFNPSISACHRLHRRSNLSRENGYKAPRSILDSMVTFGIGLEIVHEHSYQGGNIHGNGTWKVSLH